MFQSRGCLFTMTNRIKRVKEILLPEPLYQVAAVMDDFPHKGRVYDGVLLNFFRSEITENGGGKIGTGGQRMSCSPNMKRSS